MRGKETERYLPRVLAVEVTRRCNLDCIHCRAAAGLDAPEGELTLEEYGVLFENVAGFSSPIIILTGGEPLLRKDLLDIASLACSLDLRVALSTNGTLVDEGVAGKLKEIGVRSASVSIDGSSEAIHDDFRKQPGAYQASLKGMAALKGAGIRVQVNTSLTGRNMHDLDRIYRLVKRLDACAWHVFLLVPTGRGESVADRELIQAKDYERILNRIYELNRDDAMEIKPTCAPQYYRILRQRAKEDGIPVDTEHFGVNARTRGCLAGMGFGFVSFEGDVFPCGYYPKPAGSVREKSFQEIWEGSELFHMLRNFKNYDGYCGRCAYLKVCGGCRARAYALSGDDFAPEPFCEFGRSLIENGGGR